MVIFLSHLATVGYVKPFTSNFPSIGFGVYLRSIGIHLNHYNNRIKIFIFFLPFHRLFRRSEVTVGSEDASNFLKGMFVQEGSSATHFDMANLKLKSFLFTPRPTE